MMKLTGLALGALLALPAGALAGAGVGSFSGASSHQTSGTVEVVQTDSGWEVHLKGDFSHDGAPDPWVGFGKSGSFAAATDFHRLRSNSGAQVYKVPADIDPAAYDEVYIWCRRYSVPLGVAKLAE
jgi:hypothetical protein